VDEDKKMKQEQQLKTETTPKLQKEKSSDVKRKDNN
jgi:hypothetical protein